MQIIFLCAYCYARPTNLKTTTQFYFYFFRMIFPLLHQHIYGLFFKAKNRFIYFSFLDFTRILTEKYVLNLTEYHFMRLFSRTKIITLRALWKNHQKNMYVGKTYTMLFTRKWIYIPSTFSSKIYIRNMQ